MKPGEIDQLVRACDTNGDGVIDYDEFRIGIMKLQQGDGTGYVQRIAATHHHLTAQPRPAPCMHGALLSRILHPTARLPLTHGTRALCMRSFGGHDFANRPKQAMVLKHELGKQTDKAASTDEVNRYLQSLKDAVETKYGLLRKAFMAIDKDK